MSQGLLTVRRLGNGEWTESQDPRQQFRSFLKADPAAVPQRSSETFWDPPWSFGGAQRTAWVRRFQDLVL